MPAELCPVKNIPCPQIIKTGEGPATTLSLVNRMSGRGDTPNPISTSGIDADYIFRQSSPPEIISLYSNIPILGLIRIHSCDKCTSRVAGVLDELKL